MKSKNNFEVLLAMASHEYCIRGAQEFLALDTTGFEITDDNIRRFEGIKNDVKRKHRAKTLRILAAACLIALSVCITACVAIPEVRNAIKRAVVEWYNGYVSVEFVEQPQTDDNENESEAESTPSVAAEEKTKSANEQAIELTSIVKPTTIEKKAYATGLPSGYRFEVDLDISGHYMITYYDSTEAKFSLEQCIITQNLVWADSEEQNLQYITINGFQAILFEDKSENLYSIIWQDNEYEYHIDGYFESVDKLIEVAECIELK